MENKLTLAIIGASSGQQVLYSKAKEMGLRVVGFAWNRGAIPEDLFDEFFEMSVTETDTIANKCQDLRVDGVVTNASEFLAPLAAKVAEKLGLICTPSGILSTIQNKEKVRILTSNIEGLTQPQHFLYPDISELSFPCVVKPIKGASKKGVSYCDSQDEFEKAIEYACIADCDILIEEYISGREFSVESLSFHGKHYVVQITDKQSSGPPHFVELGHHQPTTLSDSNKERVTTCVKRILDKVNFQNGATHIEMKLNEKTGNIYLIEINCRGGGDHISDTLVGLSTDCDYIGEIINISLNRFKSREYKQNAYSGICYLCQQNSEIQKYFTNSRPTWVYSSERNNDTLSEATSNYDRDGFIIYKSLYPLNL